MTSPILSAFRQSGRQIVCAVEDEALADLLCRRLTSTGEQLGRRITIDTGPNGAAEITKQKDIFPMPRGQLRNTSGNQAI